jgi:hypothetical protein
MSIRLTKQEILKEIVQCSKDPLYFVENYAKISHPMKGIIPFRLYPFQKEVLKDFRANRFVAVLKARQMGISTLIAGYAMWYLLFQKGKFVLVVATQLKTASNLIKKMKRIHRNLPDWLKIAAVTTDNERSFGLANDSIAVASTTSGDAGRSEAVSLLIVDEAAHIEGMEELWAGIYPGLSTGGSCIALSSPKGAGNWFHKIYTDAEANLNDFKPIQLHWSLHPDRDNEWFENETKAMSKRQIAQELECSFLMSGDSVIDTADIEKLEKKILEPVEKTGYDKNLWIWEFPKPDKRYMLVADTARGDASDYSAFHVIDVDNFMCVAEYQGKLNIDMYALMIKNTATDYNHALVIPENNNLGYMTASKILEFGYKNMYYEKKSSHEQVDALEADLDNLVPGFNTGPKNRILLIAKLEEYVRMGVLKTFSLRLINEMKTFVWKNSRPEPMTKQYHDDLILSLAIGCWVHDTVLVNSQRDSLMKKALIDSIVILNKTSEVKVPGQVGYNVKRDSVIRSLSDREDHYKNFAWVFEG